MFFHTHICKKTNTYSKTIAKEQWRETTGFTMSVGRLAEPPKPSFLLLSKVSQSHPFMCNACKPMHSDTTAQQRDMGARMGCYQNGSEHTSTTGQQQYSKYQYPTMASAAGATGAADTEEGRRTTWRAVSHRKRLQVTRPCTNTSQCKLKHLHVNVLVGARVSSTDTESQDGCWKKKPHGPASS